MKLTKITVMKQLVPTEFYLSQNYPNPFKEKTIIKYCVAYKANVKIVVFNSNGEVIETLVNAEKDPGTYEVEFFACAGHSGKERYLANGNYYYRFEAGDYKNEKKMLLHK